VRRRKKRKKEQKRNNIYFQRHRGKPAVKAQGRCKQEARRDRVAAALKMLCPNALTAGAPVALVLLLIFRRRGLVEGNNRGPAVVLALKDALDGQDQKWGRCANAAGRLRRAGCSRRRPCRGLGSLRRLRLSSRGTGWVVLESARREGCASPRNPVAQAGGAVSPPTQRAAVDRLDRTW
jgi:hypothetical protein